MDVLKLTAITSLLLFSSVLGGQKHDSSPDSLYLEKGKNFNYVFKIEGTYQNGQIFYGSAVAIDDHNVLTAAHIIENYKECFVVKGDKKFRLTNLKQHPEFIEENVGHFDIAIGHSEQSFNFKDYPELHKNEDEVGKQCFIAGYGSFGTFSNANLIYDHKIRAGSNTIDGIDRDMLICSVSKKTDIDCTDLEYLIASGDSGGGLFINSKLAGINSCVVVTKDDNKIKIKEESGHTRISKFIDWIESNRKKK
jgi:hypothetical protein